MSEYYKKDDWIYRACDNTPIPACIGNTDWDTYQEWLRAGNTPLPYQPPAVDPKEQAKADLAASDKDMARIAEDLINIMVNNGVIKKEDLPKPVIAKLENRATLRKVLRADGD